MFDQGARLALVGALTVWGVVSAGGAALAGEDPEQLIKKGLELRKRGDDLGALPLFEQAHKLAPTPRAAAQRGFCEHALGRWADAEVHLSEALKSPDDPWIKKNRAAIEESLAAVKTKVAVIEVVGEPAGAEVLVNGSVVGQLPLAAPLRVSAGELEVELRSPGYRRASKSLRLEGGNYQRIVLRAEREEAAPAVATAPATTVAGAGTQTTPMPPAAPTVNAQHEGPSGLRSAAKWVSWGLGAVSLGVGFYGLSQHQSKLGDFNDGCAFDAQGKVYATGTTLLEGDCLGLKSDYESASTIAIVGFVGAGAFAVGGLILYLTEPRAEANRTAWSCLPDFGAHNRVSVGCSLRF